ncbi:MAG: IclR family transcriptional regulator [Rhodospirillales bacterium]
MRPSRKDQADKPAYFTATLAKGLGVLEALAEVEDAGLTELARRVDVSSPTLFRILATLVGSGYVQKTPDSRYRLTLKSWEMGARVVGRIAIRGVALPRMEQLVAEINESPHLAVLQGNGVVIVEKAECHQPVRVDTFVGQRAPAFCSATGKAILAYETATRLDAILHDATERFTERTLYQRVDIERELASVRRLGYAVNRGEWRQGVSAVAVPLRDRDGQVAASLSLTLPTERFTDEALKRFVPALTRTAQAISTDLGAVNR